MLGGATPWRPELLASGVLAYWDAYDGMDASATWTTRLGGITAGQATGGARPTWSAFQRNGKPAVAYDGTAQYHDISSVASYPAMVAASFLFFVGYDNGTAASSLVAYGWGSNIATQDRSLRHNNTAQKTVAVGNNGTTVAAAEPWTLVDKIIGWDQSATTATLYIDGGAAQTGALVPATVCTRGRIGASLALTAAGFFKGSKCCSVLMNRSPTTDERQRLEGWAASRFALQSILIGTHPYKNQAPTASATDIERFLDEIRDTPFTTDYHREATRRLYTPVRKLIRPDHGWKLAA